jgi:hypothetical protein
VKGIVLDVQSLEMPPAKRAWVAERLVAFRARGKEVVGTAVSAGNAEYGLLCAADRIGSPVPGGSSCRASWWRPPRPAGPSSSWASGPSSCAAASTRRPWSCSPGRGLGEPARRARTVPRRAARGAGGGGGAWTPPHPGGGTGAGGSGPLQRGARTGAGAHRPHRRRPGAPRSAGARRRRGSSDGRDRGDRHVPGLGAFRRLPRVRWMAGDGRPGWRSSRCRG